MSYGPQKPCPPADVERCAHMTAAGTQRHVGRQACVQAVCTRVWTRAHGIWARGLTYAHRALAHTCPCVPARAVLFASRSTTLCMIEGGTVRTRRLALPFPARIPLARP